MIHAIPVERLGWTLLHFLWQGTAIAALYAIARLRWTRPHSRYLLACFAMTAMAAAPLITFATIGASDAATHQAVAAGIAAASPTANPMPTRSASFPILATRALPDDAMPWLVMAWFAGALLFSARLLGGWLVAARLGSTQVHPAPAQWQQTLHQLAARLRVSPPVRLLISALVQVPTVVGWLRPVVLMPVGALAGLPAEHIEALLAHELAHIRRHDYLINILQGLAEAMLFYHPAIWWISNHLRNEREHCCDDIAVSLNGNALTYARALADLESRRPSPFTPALAANGGSLKDRIARLLGQPRRPSHATLAPGAGAAILLATAALALLGQTAVGPAFEAASIKPAKSQDFMMVRFLPGRLTSVATLRLLMQNAYALQPFQISGGPSWVDSDRYEIEAKADGAAPRDRVLQMLQLLLEDRFALKAHRETKELPVYALVAARSGIRLSPPKEGNCTEAPPAAVPAFAGNGARMLPPGSGPPPLPPCGVAGIMLQPSGARIQGGKISMSELTRALSMVLDRKVIDKTGFTELFDARLEFLPDMATGALPPPPPEAANATLSGSPSIGTALQEQFGLKLESDKGPVEVTVIDHVEKPSEN
jgi:uncharacterized protein (TIGR03435 family)